MSDQTLQYVHPEEITPYLVGHVSAEVYRQVLVDEGVFSAADIEEPGLLDVHHGWIRRRPVPPELSSAFPFDEWIVVADPQSDTGAIPITYDAASWPLGAWTEEEALEAEERKRLELNGEVA